MRDAVLRELPELEPAVSETETGDLLVVVPHPRIPCGLQLTTAGGEVTIGFGQWHTHGELLGGRTEAERIEASITYLCDILQDRLSLVISSVDGPFNHAWVTDDEAGEWKDKQPNESLAIGRWSQLAS